MRRTSWRPSIARSTKNSDMAIEVKLPRLGQGMESGTIVKWLKGEGDAVEKGEPLYELDTDKVTQEVEAEASGVLLRIAVTEGEVPVGETIAFIGQAGEAVAESSGGDSASRNGGEQPGRAGAPAGAAAPAEAIARGVRVESAVPPTPESAPKAPSSSNGRVKASPLARRIAR